jgi:hypothetical protein
VRREAERFYADPVPWHRFLQEKLKAAVLEGMRQTLEARVQADER